jgi:phage tail sheath gpL-like
LPIDRSFDGDVAWAAREEANKLVADGLAPTSTKTMGLVDLASTTVGSGFSGMSGAASQVGSSVSAGPSASEASSALTDLVKAVTELQVTVSGVSTRLESVEKKKPAVCFNCGGSDHSLKTCPEPIKDQYKKLHDKLNGK